MQLDFIAGTSAPNRGLVLLGCGKMGSALLAGWLGQGLSPADVWVIEPQPSDWLAGLAVGGLHLNGALPAQPAVAVIAVKPQMMGAALPVLARADLAGSVGGARTLCLSVAAGTGIAAYEAVMGAGTPIVRAMPNTPAAVGRGITALIGNAAASPLDMDRAEALMTAVGQVVRLSSEAQMDAVTALSGSGPAYVFHMIEAMAAAGEAQGLAPDLAMLLARATVCGAGELAFRSDDPAAQLRIDVTSPGGTTAAALGVLMDAQTGLPPLMSRAVAAAAARSKALGQ